MLPNESRPRDASRTKWRRVARVLTLAAGFVCLAVGGALTLLYLVPSLQLEHRYSAMAASFIPYGILAFALAAVLLVVAGRRAMKLVAVVALAGLAAQLWWAKPYWPAQPAGSGTTTILTMNMRCYEPGTAELGALAEQLKPDVAVIQGLYWKERKNLGEEWNELFPHAVLYPMDDLPTCGTAVFSASPLTELPPVSGQPVIEVGGSDPFLLLPVDISTPSLGLTAWADDFEQLAEAVTTYSGTPMVVAGDFNAVHDHLPMRELLADTGLQDATELAGHGWAPTFPVASWHPPLISLDHVLVSPGAVASDVETHPIRRQKHRVLSVKVTVR